MATSIFVRGDDGKPKKVATFSDEAADDARYLARQRYQRYGKEVYVGPTDASSDVLAKAFPEPTANRPFMSGADIAMAAARAQVAQEEGDKAMRAQAKKELKDPPEQSASAPVASPLDPSTVAVVPEKDSSTKKEEGGE